HVVAGGGDGVERGLTDGAVVGMDLVALPGIEGEDDIGAAPADFEGEFAAEGDRDLNLAVVMAQEGNLFDAEDLGGGELFGLAGGGELFRRGAAVVAALVAASGEHVLGAVAAGDEA